jgi:hypothetical protein
MNEIFLSAIVPFCLRQYQQIFRHCQMIGDMSNIADTYWGQTL